MHDAQIFARLRFESNKEYYFEDIYKGSGTMLFQLHWQNRSDRNETTMVAQTEVTEESGDHHLHDWVGELINRRKAECPDGWEPMVCDETSDHFWWAKKQ